MATRPSPRPDVAAIPRYVPGRRPTPRPGVTTYKLSSNENPFPPLPGVVEAVAEATVRSASYPDPTCPDLYEALEHRHPGRDLLAATGSVALIFHALLAYCRPGDEVVFAWRSFEAYPIAVAAAGATAVRVPLTADGRHDLDAMLAAVTDRTRVVMICTPNNPTGTTVSHSELTAFLRELRDDVLVLLDEAYVEFVRDDDAVDAAAVLEEFEQVVVLRTFSKAYGLAGFRVGYAVGATEVLDPVRAVALPFGVTEVAQAAAVAALAAEDVARVRIDALVSERERVLAGVRAEGWELPVSQGNFVWFPGAGTVEALAAAAEDLGIVVRAYPPDGVRVSIGVPEANDRIIGLARTVRQVVDH
ncbi:histidinol-phosphate transaminase [Nocardioides jishulii]|uniref:Histidinol-phosphate aminotransferase n=1 Tax=Nocardioides jishulii TaxID=2575440 RepID=A0A4U2YV01_9ACTN|nr:histidinol-phosphate transaminase [Nocardioides jishulii]QCX26265.1 aminotransferase class I/II-fold pyridoxal phosphate-dependent enzyme [Nocardioides jishulii]TKI63931.1 aminotransferase class I/II-fold pyridoxal phosphate-dependent enzyme [Nocardioides jishulii]